MADSNVKPHPYPLLPDDRDDQVVERRTLRDYYIILRERLWIALPLALLVALGYGYLQARETPIYAAASTMQFEKADTVVTTQGVVDPSIRNENDLGTYLQILQSNMLRNKVLDSFTPEERQIVQRAALKRAAPGAPTAAVGLPLGTVTFESIRNSFLISVGVKHEDPEAAALIANRYVDQFMRYLFENVGGKNEDAVGYLREQADRLKKEAEQRDQELQNYMKLHNLISLDNSQNLIGDRLKAVSNALTVARLNLLDFENQNNQVAAFRAQNRNLLEISFVAGHGAVPFLKTQLDALNSEQSLLAERYLENHPKLIGVAKKIEITREQLDRALALAVADLKTRLNEVRQNVATLQTEFDRHEKEALNLRELGVDFASLQSQGTVARNNYMAILDRLNQTTTTKNLEKIPLHPLDRALVPRAPYSPNIRAIVQTALGLGLVVFFGVALGLSLVDDRIKSAWDVESFIGVNLLGIIPDMSAIKDEDKYTLMLDNRQAPGVEAFLSVYSSVKIHSKLDFPKSILVTSTIPGEGKTLVSCNLAGSFARHGKRTLLIDCDLRRPMLHRHFKQPNHTGLIPWFEAGADLESAVSSNPHLGIVKVGENLSLLFSGGRSKSPTELLENPVFGQLLERLKKEYDLVVIDSPPLGAVTDSLLIAERTDEVIYVCRFNRAYRKHIRLYIRALRNGKNEVLGVVLNGLSPRRIEYYSNYRYYRSYKKYYGAQT